MKKILQTSVTLLFAVCMIGNVFAEVNADALKEAETVIYESETLEVETIESDLLDDDSKSYQEKANAIRNEINSYTIKIKN